MSRSVNLDGRKVGHDQPTYIIAEVGINHNGSLDYARRLIEIAKSSGCDAVKFQKRSPEKSTPAEMRDRMRETPWGYIPYIEYRYKVEFGREQYAEIERTCKQVGIDWFASCWDPESVEFMAALGTPCVKIPSALLTDRELLEAARDANIPVMLSTGMSSPAQIDAAVKVLGEDRLLLAHATSTYPCPREELNLRMLTKLQQQYDCPIGYSGHEVGLATTVAAVALGACFVERHITLDRAMWGSDHAASIEPQGLRRLVKDIRNVEAALGDGVKQVYESEKSAASRLRLRNTLGVD